MDYRRIWRILVSYKQLLILLPLVATIVATALTYVLPEQFESTALVVVRPFESIKFSNGGGDRKEIPDFPVNLSAPVDAPSKTYIEVIKSTAVARRIVDTLHLDVVEPNANRSALAQLRDDLKTWLKNTIRTTRNYAKYGRDIPATPFELAVEDVENGLAVAPRKDTFAFAITYRSGNPQQSAEVANASAEIFLTQSTDAYRSESARARVFTEVQLDDSRRALERARAAVLAYRDADATFDVKSEYDGALKNVSDLENTLAKSEGKLLGMRTRSYNRGNPEVIAQEAEIASLKGQIAVLRSGLAIFPEKERRMNELNLAERLAQQSYEFFRKQYEEARVKEASTVSEIRIVSRAVPELYPVKPVKYIYAGLAFLTGLLVAIGWAVFAESMNPRVRTIHDIEGEFGIPVLATIPLSGASD